MHTNMVLVFFLNSLISFFLIYLFFLVERNANTFLDNTLKVVSWYFTVCFYILFKKVIPKARQWCCSMENDNTQSKFCPLLVFICLYLSTNQWRSGITEREKVFDINRPLHPNHFPQPDILCLSPQIISFLAFSVWNYFFLSPFIALSSHRP